MESHLSDFFLVSSVFWFYQPMPRIKPSRATPDSSSEESPLKMGTALKDEVQGVLGTEFEKQREYKVPGECQKRHPCEGDSSPGLASASACLGFQGLWERQPWLRCLLPRTSFIWLSLLPYFVLTLIFIPVKVKHNHQILAKGSVKITCETFLTLMKLFFRMCISYHIHHFILAMTKYRAASAWGRKGLFCSPFESMAHRGREGMVAASRSWPHGVCRQKA